MPTVHVALAQGLALLVDVPLVHRHLRHVGLVIRQQLQELPWCHLVQLHCGGALVTMVRLIAADIRQSRCRLLNVQLALKGAFKLTNQ